MERPLPRVSQAKVVSRFLQFYGGLDLVTPVVTVPSGRVRDSQNVFQDINGGYMSLQGYESFDGQVAPSDALWATLETTITGSVSIGDVLTDDATTSFGTVLSISNDEVILSKVTGTFITGNIKVATVVVGTCVGPQIIGGGTTAEDRAINKNLAADLYRADIAAIPGTGDVLGTWYFGDVQYGFRNNAGGTAVDMYKSSSSGWDLVSLGFELPFTDGNNAYVPQVGDTIEGETSGATAVLTKIVLSDGEWAAAGDATGSFIFASQTGTFQAEEIKIGASLSVATIAADSTANAFAIPSGRFEFGNWNFTGSADTVKMYGCDGKNRAFEFDGTTFAPINTGMVEDTPTHIKFHKYQLFLSFHGSEQHSSPGFPFVWSVVLGATELALSDTITGFQILPGSAIGGGSLLTTSKNSLSILYGNNISDWNMVQYKNEIGAIEWSAQQIGNTYFLSDRGIFDLRTSQDYGNFNDASVSQLIQPWLATKKNQVTASCIVREKNQYWIFFADKTALCCTVDNGNIVAIMPMLFKHKVTCISSQENSSGDEIIMFGSDDGFVRQLYKGTSFDGDAIEWFFELHYDPFGSALTLNRYRRGTFEVTGDGYSEFHFTYSLGYGAAHIAQPIVQNEQLSLVAELWDSFTWDSFNWDGVSLSPTYFDMTGNAENISLIFRSNKDYLCPLRYSGATVQYTPLKDRR